jgi:hypothetical protein
MQIGQPSAKLNNIYQSAPAMNAPGLMYVSVPQSEQLIPQRRIQLSAEQVINLIIIF